jgi:hypothetical protein
VRVLYDGADLADPDTTGATISIDGGWSAS